MLRSRFRRPSKKKKTTVGIIGHSKNIHSYSNRDEREKGRRRNTKKRDVIPVVYWKMRDFRVSVSRDQNTFHLVFT